MAYTRDELDRYIVIFKALSNPHRLRILIAAGEEMREEHKWVCDGRPDVACQRDYAEIHEIAPSTMSHHLKELANAGLLTVRRDGQRIVWGLNRSGIRALRLFVEGLDP
jgi:ArsR family transcriptional regulator